MPYLVNNTSTTSKRSLWPPEYADHWVYEANGSTLYVGSWGHIPVLMDDWGSALGANTLGYGFPAQGLHETEAAATLPWYIEGDFAEQFCRAMDAEAVRFFKSGSDALSCAVRLARAFTGRDAIFMFDKSYHGTASEFKPIAWNKKGYPDTLAFSYPFGEEFSSPNYEALAAIVVEPAPKAIIEPPAGWLQHLREACDRNGIILISDEVILGYRHALRGYAESQGVRADVRCYGKAMGQGTAISAVCGRGDLLSQLASEVHFSGTNNGEPFPLFVASRTLHRYETEDICGQLNGNGAMLRQMLHREGFETQGLNSRFEVKFESPEQKMDCTRFMWQKGILFPGFASLTICHTPEMMHRLVQGLKEWRG